MEIFLLDQKFPLRSHYGILSLPAPLKIIIRMMSSSVIGIIRISLEISICSYSVYLLTVPDIM